MFKLDCKELFGINIKLWVYRVAENSEIDLYHFAGGEVDTESRYTSLKFTSIKTKDKLQIPCVYNGYAPNADTLNTQDYIIATKRSRVVEIIRNVATRPAYNDMWNGIPKKYLQLLEKEKPEWII